jgi:hypothetical protein
MSAQAGGEWHVSKKVKGHQSYKPVDFKTVCIQTERKDCLPPSTLTIFHQLVEENTEDAVCVL